MTNPRLPPGQQLAAPGKWPLVGERKPLPVRQPWTLTLEGCLDRPRAWTLEQLQALPQVERAVDIHCVTRWSMLGGCFRGVMLEELLKRCDPQSQARYVSFVAHTERQHSTSLVLPEALELGAFLAWEHEGKPLAVEHGGPLRVITPGRYFYKSLKWLCRIELLSQDRLGYWEQEAGYHNRADPWCEERYLAPALDRREAARRIAARDFRSADLRSLDAADHNLEGLDARDALLRDANFRRARLAGARFEGANLSNAHFQGADLRQAAFCRADLEGADFAGADLRGADLQGASLFGASFFSESAPAEDAVLDTTTRFDDAALEQLTPLQRAFVERARRPAG